MIMVGQICLSVPLLLIRGVKSALCLPLTLFLLANSALALEPMISTLLPDWYALYTALAKSLSDKPYHARSMTWLAGTAQRLKRVFNIDITECEKCQKHNVTIIACITEPAIIHKILSYLDKHGSSITANSARAPPFEAVEQTTVFDDCTFQRDFDFGA